MWTKIAFKNVRKSAKDYSIYFLTLVFAVAIFYMFNSIYAQQELMQATKAVAAAVKMIEKVTGYVSVVVAVILGFLIVYANNFFMKRRKKELGLYLTLGMRREAISFILILETSFLALLALLCGLGLGILLSQIMSVFTARMFQVTMLQYRFVISGAAVAKSVLYFGILFLIVAVFNVFTISRFKLIDLLYGGRKNERRIIKDGGMNLILFALAIIALGIAYMMVLRNSLLELIVMGAPIMAVILGLGIVGTLLFFYSLVGLVAYYSKGREFYYRDLNMFTVRQFTSKINTNFLTIAVISIVLFLTASIFSVGYSLQQLMQKEGVVVRADDYTYYYIYQPGEKARQKSIYEMLPESLRDKDLIKSEVTVNTYRGKDEWLPKRISSWASYVLGENGDYMRVSDYNKLGAKQGKSPITLEEGTFTLVNNSREKTGYDDGVKEIIQDGVTLDIKGKAYRFVEKKDLFAMDNMMSSTNVIVPDEVIDGLENGFEILSIDCKNDKANNEYYDRLEAEQESLGGTVYEKQPFAYATSRIQDEADAIGSRAIYSFLAIYIGAVFMITCAAILAIQQLSEAADNKKRYELLQKLGAERSMINRALFTQVAVYFAAPLLLAIAHTVVGIMVVARVVAGEGSVNMTKSISLTALFILVLYLAYFIMTYVSVKNVVYKN